MRIRRVWVVLAVTTLAIFGGAMALSQRQSIAQTKPAPVVAVQDKRSVRGEESKSEIILFERKRVKGEPFSATLLIEETPEGSTETLTSTSLMYRDKEGRTRRDQMRANSTNAPEISKISDPVAGFAYELKHSDSTARRTKLGYAQERSGDAVARMRNSVTEQKRGGSYQMFPVPADGNPKELKPKGASVVVGGSNSESLGEKDIEGVSTEGTRTIVTIPVGERGNERALEIVTERWYSPTLNTVVLIERLDPRFGRSVYRLTGIQRSEPAANLFSVPGKYKILVE